MRIIPRILFVILTLCTTNQTLLLSQIVFDTLKSVKLTALVDAVEPSITVKWIIDPGSSKYEVFKKNPESPTWGSPIFVTANKVSSFRDQDIIVGQLYEYRVKKYTAGYIGNGYLYSGIDYLPKSYNQWILLVIEEETFDSTEQSIEIFEEVLFNEGWITLRELVNKDSSAQYLRSRIIDIKKKYGDLSAVLLVGNVPIPHSGNINPDAHSDHRGAWPADLYYGELDGKWTDLKVRNTSSANPRNHNVPGDGKLDQNYIPDSIDLAVGRIDFSELPIYEVNEYELLRNYFRKNIAFRTREYIPRQRAVFKNRNQYSEGLGQNAIRNFSVLVSPDSIVYKDFFDAFYESFLWSYGGSSGSQISSLGLGNINTYVKNNFQATFTAYFGSYYGDYDFENNYLRTVLASGTVLTTAWVGAPHWFYHPMAMGLNMGFSTVLTQNNVDTYHAGDFPGSIHVNLLGDPTLKSFVVTPPSNLVYASERNLVRLDWQYPSEEVLGFNVYAWDEGGELFEKLNTELLISTHFVDSCATSRPLVHYSIRALRRQVTPSGSFFNESTGISVLVENNTPLIPRADFEVFSSGDTLYTLNKSENADHYVWSLSNASIFYTENFEFILSSGDPLEITLLAMNACYSDTLVQLFKPSDISETYLSSEIRISPNPLHSGESLQLVLAEAAKRLTIFNANGEEMQEFHNLVKGEHTLKLTADAPGHYYLKFRGKSAIQTKRLLILN